MSNQAQAKLSTLSFTPRIAYMWGFIPTLVDAQQYEHLLSTADAKGFGRIAPPNTCIYPEFALTDSEEKVVEAINKTIINFDQLGIDDFTKGSYTKHMSFEGDSVKASEYFDIVLLLQIIFESELFEDELNRLN